MVKSGGFTVISGYSGSIFESLSKNQEVDPRVLSKKLMLRFLIKILRHRLRKK